MCDRRGVGQAVLNLLLNAVDAAEQGQQPEVRVQASSDSDWAYLLVDDNGPGVSEEIRDRIFVPFFTTKPPGKGTGLGLSVCRQLIRAVGGDVYLAREPGPLGGARFVVQLPRASALE
jgi:signal transduction histidine kinase